MVILVMYDTGMHALVLNLLQVALYWSLHHITQGQRHDLVCVI